MDIFVSELLAFTIAVAVAVIGIAVYALSDLEGFSCIIAAIIIVVCSIGAPCLYIHLIMENTKLVNEEYYSDVVLERELCSVNFDTELRGHGEWGTILGTGGGSFVISNYEVYRYYYKDNNRIRQDSAQTSMSYIEYIDENETPKVVGYHDYKIETYCYEPTGETKSTDELNTQWYYVFYVPKDSVVESFNFS